MSTATAVQTPGCTMHEADMETQYVIVHICHVDCTEGRLLRLCYLGASQRSGYRVKVLRSIFVRV